jgi:hypothetical protein
MKTIYIAGPMRGYPEHNFPAFDAAAKELRRAGWRVLSPAEMDRVAGIHEFTDLSNPSTSIKREVMRRDCAALCEADAIALLPGWEKSAGVKVELTLAKFLGLQEYVL